MIEVLHRSGIKIALAIRQSTCNEIVCAESFLTPLKFSVKYRQLKFWKAICNSNENTKLGLLIEKAKNLNIDYIKHYIMLDEQFNTPQQCKETLKNNFFNGLREKFRNEEDENSKIGSYFKVNPVLKNPNTMWINRTFELERILISRYRTGSHNLAIETGRFSSPRIPRDERLCSCGTEIQTVTHILLYCHLLDDIRNHTFNNVDECLEWPEISKFLINASKILKVEI